ncbi:MAG: glycosyl transferase family 90 [Simkaniaceae bacterium]
MYYWIFSIIGATLFFLITASGKAARSSRWKGVQIVALMLLLALPISIVSRKFKRIALRMKMEAVSAITLEKEGGYVDVEKFLTLRSELKGPKRDKGVRNHLRLAEIRLLHPPLSEAFYKLVENPPQWMIEEIQKQLAHFKANPPTSLNHMIEKFQKIPDWEDQLLLAKYKIKEGRLYVKDYSKNHNTLQYMNAALVRLVKAISLPDLEFVISFHDSLDWIHLEAPIFVHCKREGNPYIIVIPDHEILTGYETLDQKIDLASEASPWEEKKDIAFWRGSTTSGDFSLPHWRSYPRSKLVFMARESELIDAKFSLYVLGAESNPELLAEENLKGEFLYPEESLGYKYLIDVDGNASTYSRYYWILRSNCVPLKQMSTFQMWYFPALKPFVHYIPYAEDLSDLPQMVAWAKAHPKESRDIAENGRQFVLNRLTTEHAYAYLYLLLKEYATLSE